MSKPKEQIIHWRKLEFMISSLWFQWYLPVIPPALCTVSRKIFNGFCCRFILKWFQLCFNVLLLVAPVVGNRSIQFKQLLFKHHWIYRFYPSDVMMDAIVPLKNLLRLHTMLHSVMCLSTAVQPPCLMLLYYICTLAISQRNIWAHVSGCCVGVRGAALWFWWAEPKVEPVPQEHFVPLQSTFATLSITSYFLLMTIIRPFRGPPDRRDGLH